jgi:hypothetical protein
VQSAVNNATMTLRLSVAVNGYPPEKGEPMPSHKFHVGDAVIFKPRGRRNAPWGVYEVLKVLPGDGEPEYRVKSANEEHERVARESELTRA